MYRGQRHDLGPFPAAVAGAGDVHGEVHGLDREHFAAVVARLDAYEGDEYRRVICPVWPDDAAAPLRPETCPVSACEPRRY